ncbi:hypothetical protein [Streptococcus macacae]|uniref:Uncharacterized protein n=1 Tax=Streptococcus macacae NCTC 11558 TaxID=764298 RepID=G5JVV8_9STRE|nr:hypothetical protein [Streptococcus macacae]EHJ52360.1 hypothetical protein STRMA_1126 [Streptococcus macacae NCTC 11558]SUN78948.1 Uncharacterised protein [Streptococcus macacae NCTC 11558]
MKFIIIILMIFSIVKVIGIFFVSKAFKPEAANSEKSKQAKIPEQKKVQKE